MQVSFIEKTRAETRAKMIAVFLTEAHKRIRTGSTIRAVTVGQSDGDGGQFDNQDNYRSLHNSCSLLITLCDECDFTKCNMCLDQNLC